MAGWTEAEDKMLAYLTEAGISARLIATHFPGRSRNSIIGRQHRIGLKAGPRPRASAPLSMPLKPPRDHRYHATINVAKLRELREDMEAAAKAPPKEKPKAARHVGEPAPLMVPLLDLEPRMCRWIHGDVGQDNFGYCGHETNGSSYCAYHDYVAHHGYPKLKKAA